MKFGTDHNAGAGIGDFYKLTERFIRAAEEAAAKSVATEGEKKLTIETINTHIYFYADVDTDRCLALIRSIRETDAMLRNERMTRSIPDEIGLTPIWLHIQSNGGDLFAGLAIADQFAKIETPIYSVVEGCCASAATLISAACTKRYILTNGFMLIHQLSSRAWGKYEEFKDHQHILDMLMESLTNFYAKHSRMSRKKVESLLKRDSWFNADQCIAMGLVDDVWGK